MIFFSRYYLEHNKEKLGACVVCSETQETKEQILRCVHPKWEPRKWQMASARQDSTSWQWVRKQRERETGNKAQWSCVQTSEEKGPGPVSSQATALCASVASNGQPCTADTTELNPSTALKRPNSQGLCLSMCSNKIQIPPLVFCNMLIRAGGI